MAYLGLYALQHRGQESAGIAASDGERVCSLPHSDMGLVAEIFTADVAGQAAGRWPSATPATPPPATRRCSMPSPSASSRTKGLIAMAHNGNLVNARNIRAATGARRARFPDHQRHGSHRAPDRALPRAGAARRRHRRLAAPDRRRFLPGDDDRATASLPRAIRAASARSRWAAIRRTADGHRRHRLRLRKLRLRSDRRRITSATCAPGELVMVTGTGWRAVALIRSGAAAVELHLRARVLRASRQHDLRPLGAGKPRRDGPPTGARSSGVTPTSWCPCPTPASLRPWAMPQESGIPFRFGLIRNHYVGRTFIEPEQRVRDFGVRLKLNPVRNRAGRQARRPDRRLHHPRHHQPQDRPHGARRRRPRSSHAHLLPAHHLALLLRRGHAQQARADRRQQISRRDPAVHRAPTRWRIFRWRACDKPPATAKTPSTAPPATPGNIPPTWWMLRKSPPLPAIEPLI